MGSVTSARTGRRKQSGRWRRPVGDRATPRKAQIGPRRVSRRSTARSRRASGPLGPPLSRMRGDRARVRKTRAAFESVRAEARCSRVRKRRSETFRSIDRAHRISDRESPGPRSVRRRPHVSASRVTTTRVATGVSGVRTSTRRSRSLLDRATGVVDLELGAELEPVELAPVQVDVARRPPRGCDRTRQEDHRDRRSRPASRAGRRGAGAARGPSTRAPRSDLGRRSAGSRRSRYRRSARLHLEPAEVLDMGARARGWSRRRGPR